MVPFAVRVVLLAAPGLLALAGCSSTPTPSTPSTETSSSTRASAAPTTATESLAPDAVEVSPGGVTTKVGAPAESTEDDYFQNCRAARTYMDTHGGDPKAQIEPYLKMLQSAPTVGSGEFDKSWTQLSAGQQSAIIVAVESAADALCG
ncbi:LpqV [Mycobacterium sp. SWH-M1]|uniref:lipoprotein LpqV n=1 Tax=Mycobacterium kyogaense TaxID=2212479 RepID=UPI00093AA46B|nr:lipoprotein LpqV [Mycobacterium kyogaense]OKH76586.1 LpqV [Mycobacterium sp. SWH-M1]